LRITITWGKTIAIPDTGIKPLDTNFYGTLGKKLSGKG
jgi:hypothetical protein